MKKIIITVLSAFLFSTTTTFAGNDDNSNKLAGSETSLIEVANLKNNSAYWSGNGGGNGGNPNYSGGLN